MNFLVQDQFDSLHDLKFAHIDYFKDVSIEEKLERKFTFNGDESTDIELQRRNSILQNETVLTIDEHEDNSSSLKRKFKSVQITSTDKLQKQKISHSSKEAKEYRKNEVDNSEAVEDVNLVYAIVQQRLKYGHEELALTSKKTSVPNDTFNKQIRNNKAKILLNMCKSEIPERSLIQFKQHFEHAVNCPKLKGGSCMYDNCKEPDKVKECINENIRQEYNVGGAARVKGQDNVNIVHEVVMDHVLQCDNPQSCNMPICPDFQKELEDIMPETEIEDTHFEVVYSSNPKERKVFFKKGVDFDIPVQLKIGSGAWGNVSHACFVNAHGRKSSAVVKKIDLNKDSEKMWSTLGKAVANMKLVERMPNLLVPDLILRSENAAYFIQEKADMSLFHLMRRLGSLSPDAVVYYLFEMAKALNQLHNLGLTHGDVKLPNCVLMNDCRQLKFIDFDTLKKEDEFDQSGTPGYHAPEMGTRGVTKAADVYSLVSCIAVMFAGNEKILKEDRDYITKFIYGKHPELASMYFLGTMLNPDERITAQSLVKWFRISKPLSMQRKNYVPQTPKRCVTDENLSNVVLRDFFTKKLDSLPHQLYDEEEEL